jgi:RimJ/RimL family protein N-acetyltransferase
MTIPADVHIRPYRLDDAPAVFDAVCESAASLMPWMPWCHPDYSIDETRTWLELQIPAFDQGTAYEFGIFGPYGRYLGGCGLNQVDAANKRANLGYWVRRSAQGYGAASAAVQLLREWGFTQTDLIRLEIVVAVGNLASLRVAERSGATREGTLRQRLHLHGTSHDAAVFSFVRTPSISP